MAAVGGAAASGSGPRSRLTPYFHKALCSYESQSDIHSFLKEPL